ncbi:N-terminal acetyltransferase A, auxiliary subunit [Cynara cardunculus var. scolymus]|uniref:N-terminal acetyltransferase A, auxiliary subunit n=1 Tax=Cynara cardunculus var. scolymus TaxID=59895 RepID=A0A124SGC4_CYNCS|nr:N-terminal acetyltransferase A, auxiliary subunit [Cynara cardunculus var. scolymus]
MGASLPPKEANLFKLIVKSYETKQYKKGLKAADAILKKFPEHGETLSMKGLTLNCMDRKPEAYELVRLGLKNDLKSHVCWHVYGLLYRSDREYREAIKCYRNALRIDPDNIEILRDLSLLQAQMRDLGGFVETRQQLLTLKPNHRMNWIGFAVSHHLNSNASKAIDILEAYEGTLEDDYPPDNERCEHGEMLLYKISLLEECGSLEKALQELRKKEFKIVDKLSYKEEEVSLLVKLNRLEEGEKLYRVLLAMNPDNYRYYEGLQMCVGLHSKIGQYSPDEIDKLDALYKSLGQQYTWSSAVKRIPLDFLEDVKFRDAADNYVRPLLTKGVPSLFSDLSPLYDHPGKASILERLLLDLEESLKTTGGYPGRSEKEPPSTLLWTLFYLAQHYDRRGLYDIALAKIDEAMQHTPTVIDLYSVKSKILKHGGDFAAAAALADEARCMDLADRYSSTEEDDELAKLPASQKKKLRQKQRKAEARAKKEAEVKGEEANVGGVSKSGKRHVKPVDPDPHGEKLLQTEDPLMEAGKYLKLLQKHSSDFLETHLLSFEVNMRKQKILLALQALKQLQRLDAGKPDSHRCLLRFFHKVASRPAPATDDSLMHRAAVAEMSYCLEPNKKGEAIKLIEESPNNLVNGSLREWKLKDCVAVHKLLVSNFDDQDAALRWKSRCAGYFPYSSYFEGRHCSANRDSKQAHTENGSVEFLPSNGKVEKLEALKNLAI